MKAHSTPASISPPPSASPSRRLQPTASCSPQEWLPATAARIMVDHGNGVIQTLYGHLLRIRRYPSGEQVKRGQIIGYVGTSGRSTRSPPPLRGANPQHPGQSP